MQLNLPEHWSLDRYAGSDDIIHFALLPLVQGEANELKQCQDP